MSSQASACTIARSRGGKIELSPASRFVLQREVALCPAASPASNRDSGHLDLDSRLGMRHLRFMVKLTGQRRPLAQLKSDGTSAQKRLRVGQELGREVRTMRRFGAAHGWHPVALRSWVSIRRPSVYQKPWFGNVIIICEIDH